MQTRKEKDSLGEVEVPADKFWGAQTERSRINFPIGNERMPKAIIHAYALIKKAAAKANCEAGILDEAKRDAICDVCDQIVMGTLDDHFPLVVWQTGSGTQTNMNVNEVIAHRASVDLHPNDDVNMSQSSNDTFPTAMHIAATLQIHSRLLPNLGLLRDTLERKAEKFANLVKSGRTHLMDEAPVTLGQEFSGYMAQIDHGIEAIEGAMPHLRQLALGGTAVGTGLNAPEGFGDRTAELISDMTGHHFVTAPNKFEALAAHDAIVEVSGALRRVAVSLMKIANDIRWMASGPRCGLAEITIPANEPGSSIMPGKVNPTQIEALTMVCVQVMGNDTAIAIAGSQGNFELNVYKPVMIHNLLRSVRLLGDAVLSFTQRCVVGIEANEERLAEEMTQTLQLAAALNRKIGYDKASQIVKKAYSEKSSLKEAAISLKILSEAEFDRIIDPKKLV